MTAEWAGKPASPERVVRDHSILAALESKLQDYATLAIRDSVDKKLRRFRRAFVVDSKFYVVTDAAADESSALEIADCTDVASALGAGARLYERRTHVLKLATHLSTS